MNTRLLIILFVLSTLLPVTDIFAPPSPNEWSSAPYCPGRCPMDYLKQKWVEYYDYKGSEWMEIKKQEMLDAIENGTLDEWRDKDPTMAHSNVYAYYVVKGEIPDFDGMFFDPASQVISSPLKQIKNGVALIDIQCSEGKYAVYKYNRMRVACVSEETQNELWSRGWATMRLSMPGDDISHALCNNYEGKWHQEYNGCRDISDLQCSLIGGKFVDDLKICENGICPERGYAICVAEPKKLDWKIINSDSQMTPLVFQVPKDEKIFDVEYDIIGGMIKDITFSNSTNSLLVKIDSTDKGNLTLGIPRNLLDAKLDYCPPRQTNAPDDRFFVMLDGEEIFDDEILTTVKARTLKIPFDINSEKIEVIGTCFV